MIEKNNPLKIGVPACIMYPDISRTTFGKKTLYYIEQDMGNYVAQGGAIPILIPEFDDENDLHEFIKEMDGFLFQGGADLSPESYGEDFLDKDKWPGDRQRDLFEYKVMEYAKKKKKPVFAICRGFQLVNCYLGGTLHQDIQTELPNANQHRDAIVYDELNHDITIDKGKYLHQIYNKDKIRINTVHHQCVKKLGDNLVSLAVSSADNIVEAYCNDDMDDHYILGVQWHPEFSHTLKEKVEDPAPLMTDFLNQCKKLRKK